jgi:hypothetical protein
MKNDKRLVEAFDMEYNSLSKTMKMNLLLDEEAIRLIIQTSAKPLNSPNDIRNQVVELLERSIHLNLPRKMQQGPHGRSWNHVK